MCVHILVARASKRCELTDPSPQSYEQHDCGLTRQLGVVTVDKNSADLNLFKLFDHEFLVDLLNCLK